MDRSSPARHGPGGAGGGAGGGTPQHQHQQQQHGAADGYKVACRDRWMNVTKAMMGERAEITITSGCVYEGVFHVLSPGEDPRPGAKRGMYRVRAGLRFCFPIHLPFLVLVTACGVSKT